MQKQPQQYISPRYTPNGFIINPQTTNTWNTQNYNQTKEYDNASLNPRETFDSSSLHKFGVVPYQNNTYSNPENQNPLSSPSLQGKEQSNINVNQIELERNSATNQNVFQTGNGRTIAYLASPRKDITSEKKRLPGVQPRKPSVAATILKPSIEILQSSKTQGSPLIENGFRASVQSSDSKTIQTQLSPKIFSETQQFGRQTQQLPTPNMTFSFGHPKISQLQPQNIQAQPQIIQEQPQVLQGQGKQIIYVKSQENIMQENPIQSQNTAFQLVQSQGMKSSLNQVQMNSPSILPTQYIAQGNINNWNLEDLLKNYTELKKEYDNQMELTAKMKLELDNMKNNRQNEDSLTLNVKNENTALKYELTLKDKEITALQNDITNLKNIIHEKDLEILRLNNVNSKILDDKNNEIQDLTNKLSQFKAHFEAEKIELDIVRNNTIEAQTHIREQAIDSLKSHYETIIQKMREDNEKLLMALNNNHNGASADGIKQLENEIKTLNQEIEKLKQAQIAMINEKTSESRSTSHSNSEQSKKSGFGRQSQRTQGGSSNYESRSLSEIKQDSTGNNQQQVQLMMRIKELENIISNGQRKMKVMIDHIQAQDNTITILKERLSQAGGSLSGIKLFHDDSETIKLNTSGSSNRNIESTNQYKALLVKLRDIEQENNQLRADHDYLQKLKPILSEYECKICELTEEIETLREQLGVDNQSLVKLNEREKLCSDLKNENNKLRNDIKNLKDKMDQSDRQLILQHDDHGDDIRNTKNKFLQIQTQNQMLMKKLNEKRNDDKPELSARVDTFNNEVGFKNNELKRLTSELKKESEEKDRLIAIVDKLKVDLNDRDRRISALLTENSRLADQALKNFNEIQDLKKTHTKTLMEATKSASVIRPHDKNRNLDIETELLMEQWKLEKDNLSNKIKELTDELKIKSKELTMLKDKTRRMEDTKKYDNESIVLHQQIEELSKQRNFYKEQYEEILLTYNKLINQTQTGKK